MKTQRFVVWLWFCCLGLLGWSCKESVDSKPRSLDNESQNTLVSPPTDQINKDEPIIDGPFVEPPLDSRPDKLHIVVVGLADSLERAHELCGQVSLHGFIPVGYPAVDQADSLVGLQGKWVVVAGKYARKNFAEALCSALRQRGLDSVSVVEGAYRYDRFRPSAGFGQGDKAGVVFAGMPGAKIPLLDSPSIHAAGLGMLQDGRLVRVLSVVENDNRDPWYRIQSADQMGYLQAARLCVDYNVFPAATGRHAVLGVSLGCSSDDCLWDYWLVNQGYKKRRLLAAAAGQLPHAFSPDGKLLAYEAPEKPLRIVSMLENTEVTLGSGTSPTWTSDGGRLYYRKLGRKGERDQVMAANSPNWNVKTLLDFPGTPVYPKILSIIPPRVDLLKSGSLLFTMFYRLDNKGDTKTVNRWKVWFKPDGKVLKKASEQITE